MNTSDTVGVNLSHSEQCIAFLSSLRDKGVQLFDGWAAGYPTNELMFELAQNMDSEDWLELSCYSTEVLLESAKAEGLI